MKATLDALISAFKQSIRQDVSEVFDTFKSLTNIEDVTPEQYELGLSYLIFRLIMGFIEVVKNELWCRNLDVVIDNRLVVEVGSFKISNTGIIDRD